MDGNVALMSFSENHYIRFLKRKQNCITFLTLITQSTVYLSLKKIIVYLKLGHNDKIEP